MSCCARIRLRSRDTQSLICYNLSLAGLKPRDAPPQLPSRVCSCRISRSVRGRLPGCREGQRPAEEGPLLSQLSPSQWEGAARLGPGLSPEWSVAKHLPSRCAQGGRAGSPCYVRANGGSHPGRGLCQLRNRKGFLWEEGEAHRAREIPKPASIG